MRTISVLVLGMVLCLGAWAADSTIHGLPNGTAPLPADVTIIDRESPPGTWHNYKLPLSSIATTQVITTNYYTFGTNYYYNDTYVSNYFETNILVDATSSNYFATYNYVTNTYQTNVTIEQYISNNSYVSNYVTTNIFNDTYTSNYFATNLFPTTYVYVTNTIGGAFIANNGGEGTNTVLRGNTLITKAYGDGSGLTNLPSTGGSQVWTNDGTAVRLLDESSVENIVMTNSSSDISGSFNLSTKHNTLFVGNANTIGTNVDSSVILGDNNTLPTESDYLYILGNANTVSNSSFVAGQVIVGSANTVNSDFRSLGVFGNDSYVGGSWSYSLGSYNYVDGQYGLVIGTSNVSTNGYGYAFGDMNNVWTESSSDVFGIGSYNYATNDNSMVVGFSLNTSGTGDFRIGRGDNYPIHFQAGTNTATLDTNGAFSSVRFVGAHDGDGSGLTNLTAVQDIIYNNTNIFNVAKGGTLVITNNIHPYDASWSGPTNLISYTNALQNYTALVPCSITNTANVMAGVGNSCLLCITNASSTNITVLVPATFKVGIGESNLYTVTNADIIELWFYEASGRKTVTARGFH